MKVLFVHSLADPTLGGGAETTVRSIATALAARGVGCVLVATGRLGQFEKSVEEGITVWRVGIRNFYWPFDERPKSSALKFAWHARDVYNAGMQRPLKHLLGIEQPDVVSVHNVAGWSAAVWRTLGEARFPYVQVLHDYYHLCIRSTLFADERRCAKRCVSCTLFRLPHSLMSRRVRHVVSVSRFVKERHISAGLFAQASSHSVIRDVRKPRPMRSDGNPEVVTDGGGVVFGFLGTLTESKGVHRLVDAFSKAEADDASLLIAGEGRAEYKTRLAALARGSTADIRLIGRVDADSFFNQIDVLVVPSTWDEPLGTVVPEALNAGKPVLVARRGGLSELFVEGYNGVGFDPEDEDEFVRIIQKASQDRVWTQALAHGARASGTKLSDFEGWIDQYERVYRKAIESVAASNAPVK